MELLEREASFEALQDCLAEARAGRGRVALVYGEAGIGKSALVDRFCALHQRDARVLRGACDALSTPRVLGPLLDMAPQAGGPLEDLAREGGGREVLFTAFLDALDVPASSVAVIEDAHWADDATLDLVKFVARRLTRRRALVIVTYRDDEVGSAHPLRVVLGDLATTGALRRVQLAPLSHSAVSQLAAGHDIDAERLYERTAGNPFYVTEALAVPAAEVPPTVRDAVLARAARLSGDARAVLDAAAVVPARVERWLLTGLTGARPADVDACVTAGTLRPDGDGLAFRHELARLAVEAAVAPARRTALHHRIVELLLDPSRVVDPARIAAHADQAGDADTVLAHAPTAGARAAQLGAHREAAAHYGRALRHADGLAAAERAALLERYAEECSLTDRVSDAVDAQREAVALWRETGDRLRAGAALSALARNLWNAGRNADCDEALDAAIETLDAFPAGPELALAYATRATMRMLARELSGAISWGARAIELAERVGEREALARALNSVGCAQLLSGDAGGRATLERSVAVGREAGSDHYVGVGLSNLGTGLGEVRDYAAADEYLQASIAHAGERDLDALAHYAAAWWARSRFEQGHWVAAGDIASSVLRHAGTSPISRIVALTVLGRLRARRGDPAVAEALDEAWELATATGDLQRLWPVAAGRAEAAWFAREVASIPGLVADTFALGRRLGHPWSIGELGYWLWRGGELDDPPANAYEPYALQIAGRHGAAAARWGEIGCPYERAVALADSDDEDALRDALASFERMGARIDAAATSRRLRELGVRGIARGPRPATRANPAGLTPRQMEVLELLGQGCSNADIARRLFITEKTAGHHVSAILAKLAAGSRGAAVAAAARLGIDLRVPGSEQQPSWN
jgi:DNA-binding CsgD family transcriptional regulator/tetratricopeptide (TPR) repeat protein